jgi:cobalt-zinc-cadmium resistance protein CzcA
MLSGLAGQGLKAQTRTIDIQQAIQIAAENNLLMKSKD